MILDIYEIHGDEREVKGFPLIRAVPGLRPHSNDDLQAGLICEDQSLDDDFSAAAERAQTACLKTESKQPKKTASTTEVKCEHVDDIQIYGPKGSKHIAELKQDLRKRFAMTDLGPCSYYLGMEMQKD